MRDQGPYGPGFPPPSGDGRDPGRAPVSRGPFGVPRPPGGPERPPVRNGHTSPSAVGRPFEPAPADDDGPVDLVELQADDELINALSSGLGVSGPGNRGYDVDDRLVALLSSWKDDVERQPVPDLVDTDDAVAMLQPARPVRKVSFLRPLLAAAAVAACALAVVSISAYEAQPGDSLWSVSRVLYSERAEQVQAAADLREGIERVNAKLATGDTAGARLDLVALEPLLRQTDPQQRDDFEQQNRFLTKKVDETPPGTPIDPRSPLRDGTPAPPPPVTSEGRPDEGRTEPRPSPAESGTSTSGGESSSGTTRPEGTSPSRNDPRMLSDPGAGEGSEDPRTGTTRPTETSPTTEGSPDPSTTPATPATPTASGEGGADESAGPTSSTTSGAVSSTTN
ncbi:anti-sigma-D factor RsdA [Pseudonocardia sp. HH130630-07]|uniref:anti-sigma-D factor RsdA n=1 Tax=Pseudonocardia sp. HH130630-07 TaxID=1690815 RepID=UPI0008152DE3|nr:anti-sigma-D factor RsdA [Pseudonocardia sp. HH130630-07]ANY07460.1 hypothetical protein AFB00_15465 [Pseudonocardia sp. HH130630-07]